MANEFIWDTAPGLFIYAIRWQPDGDVFLSDGASDEEYGDGAHDADDYDVAMPEVGTNSGHYVGHFDAGANIAAGIYPYTFYVRQGANPADSDRPVAKGMKYWDGTSEVNNIMTAIVEGTITVEEALRLMLATLTGKASGGGTGTLTFRDTEDSKDRIIATVDALGNRTAIPTRDGT